MQSYGVAANCANKNVSKIFVFDLCQRKIVSHKHLQTDLTHQVCILGLQRALWKLEKTVPRENGTVFRRKRAVCSSKRRRLLPETSGFAWKEPLFARIRRERTKICGQRTKIRQARILRRQRYRSWPTLCVAFVLNNLDKTAIFGLHISKILHEKTFGRKKARFLRVR